LSTSLKLFSLFTITVCFLGIYLSCAYYIIVNGRKRLPGAKKRRKKILPLLYKK
jgi:hypothetical protein